MGKRPKQTFLQRRHTDGQQANEKMKSSLLIIREIQVKTTMRYHLTLVSMAIIKKSTNNKCWRGCGEKGNFLYCWWEFKLVQPLWKTCFRVACTLRWALKQCSSNYRTKLMIQRVSEPKTDNLHLILIKVGQDDSGH